MALRRAAAGLAAALLSLLLASAAQGAERIHWPNATFAPPGGESNVVAPKVVPRLKT